MLVVEDEVAIADAVADRLRAEGFDVRLAHDGPAAVAAAEADEPDLVVLDVMLPGFDGIEVCRRIQAHRPVPVLMVTARDDETDILVGLGVGADDYLTKPYSIRELAARVHALLRRVDRAAELAPDRAPGARLTLGEVEIDRGQRTVYRAGEEVHLTPIEFDLLVYLASRPRLVQPRDRLLTEIWGLGDFANTRTLDSHVKELRRKLGSELIRTVHGVGYAIR
ncbi:response regulator transcription factor [Pseudonocardia eucalypti]|uniref:Response regulator transcription factor n=1 Tax=Pseudonocardia eucalypti TaxID=648755 RepID=A0ABP9QFB2_9PSEU